jgi:hypothetical protein
MKVTIQDMVDIASERGGKCLSNEYVNAHFKLEWQCELGHTWFANPNHIKTGTWCRICSKERVAASQRLDIKSAHEVAKKNNGKCLSTEYVNARTNLLWQCKEGHQWEAIYDSVSRGRWCKTCAGTDPNSIKDCHKIAKKFNGTCLSQSYVNAHTKLKWECELGHTWMASYHNVRRGQWCPNCGTIKAAQARKIPIEQIQNLAKERGGELMSKNNVSPKKLTWKCARNHQWKAVYDSVRQGGWCPVCSSGYGERATKAIFEDIFGVLFDKERPTWLKNDRGNQMEIDGYNSSLKIGFEHHGRQHYEKIPFFQQNKKSLKKRQQDDKRKEQLCKENNVKLIIVPSIPELLPLEKAIPFIIMELKNNKIKVPKTDIRLNNLQIYAGKESLFDEVKHIAEGKGGRLLTPNYLGRKKKHLFECYKKHRWEFLLDSVKNSGWCKQCENDKKLEDLKIFVRQKGGKCLSTEFIRVDRNLQFQCQLGHTWFAQPHNIKNGTWCPKCTALKRTGKSKPKSS